jgi:DNA-binding NtrC family response regulator
LLRVLESGEVQRLGATESVRVDVRIVAATHRDLAALCRAGRFREDLFYRLCVFPLHLPPLRRRPGDLELLTDHFVECFRPTRAPIHVTAATRAKLADHPFPGNVRELRNVVQRALLRGDGATLLPEHIVFDPPMGAEATEDRLDDDRSLLLPGLTLARVVDEARKRSIRRNGGNKTRAAAELGVSRSTLTHVDPGPKPSAD